MLMCFIKFSLSTIEVRSKDMLSKIENNLKIKKIHYPGVPISSSE